MKRIFYFFIISLMLFYSCSNSESSSDTDDTETNSTTQTTTNTSSKKNNGDSSTGKSSTTTAASASTTITYDSANPVTAIDSSVASVTISGLSEGQHIYLSKTNPTSTTIASKYTQYVESAENISLSDEDTTTSSSNTTSGTSSSSSSGPAHKCFLPSLNESDFIFTENTSRTVGASSITSGTKVEQLSVSESDIGSTTMNVYIDGDENISVFGEAKATLRAVGEYCLVWVVNGYYETDDTGSYNFVSTSSSSVTSYTTTSDEQVSEDIVTAFAEKFDDMYPLIRNVFGEESDKIYYTYSSSTGFDLANMDYLSQTGTKVNIVIYDIGNDHSNSDESGVLGYFYSKDYYPNGNHISTLSAGGRPYSDSSVLNYSNEGKYFYVDSYFTVEYTDTTYSTLAHEFQHMINFGVKTIENNLSCGSAYNEMMSMLCEDIMQDYLDIDDDDSPIARLPFFERRYPYAGIEYREDNSTYTVLSYSTNYAFGAWLVRQFGGIKLIEQMASNSYTDFNSICAAVNAINNTSYTMKDLLCLYTQACIYSSSLTDYDVPTFNKEITNSSTYYTNTDYTYPLKAIDLWNLDSTLTINTEYVSNGYYKYDGPILYGYNAQYSLRPYGMLLVDVGTVESADDVTITFGNSSVSSSEYVYLIIK